MTDIVINVGASAVTVEVADNPVDVDVRGAPGLSAMEIAKAAGLISPSATVEDFIAYLAGLAEEADISTFPSSAIEFQAAGVGAAARFVQDKLRERVSAEDFGAIGDGDTHPLSDFYGSLVAAQVDYPFATALTQQIDMMAWWAAILASGNVEGKAGAVYVGGTAWPTASGFKLSGDPSNHPRIPITLDAAFASVAPEQIRLRGNGCVFQNFNINIYHHTAGNGHVSGITFRDTLSDASTFIDIADLEREQTIYYLFKWYGHANWYFEDCIWGSPNIPEDNDSSMGWMRSHPALGYTNDNNVFYHCTFNGRTEIDLWGGTRYKFLICDRPYGGYDDGITAKTFGEVDDDSVDGYTGDVDGVQVIGGEWHGCQSLLSCGSDMRWTARRIHLSNLQLVGVGQIWLLKPNGRGASINSSGVVEHIYADNIDLYDIDAERFIGAFNFEVGEYSLDQGAGTVRHCRSRNIRIHARSAFNPYVTPRLINYAPIDGLGLLEDIDLEFEYVDPYGGVDFETVDVPGYPIRDIIGTGVPNEEISPANVVNCRATIRVSGIGGGNMDALWSVGKAELDTLFADTTMPGSACITVPEADHRNIVLTNTTESRFLALTPDYDYEGLVGERCETVAINTLAAGVDLTSVLWIAPIDCFLIAIDLVFDEAVAAHASNYRILSLRTPMIAGDDDPFDTLTSEGGWTAHTTYRAATLGVDFEAVDLMVAPRGTLLRLGASSNGGGAKLPSGRALIHYKPFA